MREAAAYLRMSDSQFRKVIQENPWIRPFNFLPNGDAYFDREDLDELVTKRKAAGIERAG